MPQDGRERVGPYQDTCLFEIATRHPAAQGAPAILALISRVISDRDRGKEETRPLPLYGLRVHASAPAVWWTGMNNPRLLPRPGRGAAVFMARSGRACSKSITQFQF